MKKLFILIICISLAIGAKAQQNSITTYFGFGLTNGTYHNEVLNDAIYESPSRILLAYENKDLISADLTNPLNYDTLQFTNTPAASNNITALCKQGNDVWIAFESGWLAKKLSFGYQFVNLNLLHNGIIITKMIDFNGSLALATKQGLFVYNGTSLIRYFSGNSGIINDTIKSCHNHADSVVFTTKGGQVGLLRNNQVNMFTNLSVPVNAAIPDYFGNIYAISASNNAIFRLSGNGQISLVAGVANVLAPGEINMLERNSQDSSIILAVTGNYMLGIATIKQNEFYAGTLSHTLVNCNRLLLDYNQMLMLAEKKRFRNAGYFIDFNLFKSLALNNNNTKRLDINQVGAIYYNQGDIFSSHMLNTPGYAVPKNGQKSTLFTQSLWVGGKDQNNQLHVSAQTYRQNQTLGQNFRSGLIGSNGLADTVTAPQFNRIWEITKQQIIDFQTAFAAGNVTNGTFQIPKDILEWPGNRPNSTERLAPFIDVNNDNIYNPMDGDYPLIKGDKMLWWIYNDVGQNRNFPLSTALGIEIKASAYAFACGNLTGADTVLNYTTFLNYDIQNRSINTYSDTYISDFADVDLGNPTDDYVGCFVDKNTWYTYNSTDDDQGMAGYGQNPPAQAITLLNGPKANPNDGIDNNRNGIIDEPNEQFALSSFMHFNNDGSIIGNPTNEVEVYNFMNSRWRDSSFVLFGGRGANDSLLGQPCVSNTPTKFMFPGNTDPNGYGVGGSPSNPITQFPWTEYNICDTGSVANYAGDRRTLATFGPFTFAPNQTQNLELALIYSRGNNGALSSVNQLYNHDIDRIKFWYNNMQFPSCGFPLSNKALQPKSEINFFPNPNNTGLLNYQVKESGRHSYQIFNIAGKRITSGILFDSQGTLDLSTLANGMYFIQIVDGKTYKIVVNK